jgi:hypothetical protein
METVPVNARRLISQSIVYIHNDSVAKLDINLWAGPLVVDTNDGPLISIRGGIDPGNVPIEIDILGCSQLGGEASQKKEIQLGHDGS